MPLLLSFLLAFGLSASAVVGTRAPGSGSSFGGAKITPLSKSWNDAFSFVLPNRAPAPGYNKFSFLLGSGVYYPEHGRVYEPLAWALSQKYEPLSFVQLAPEAQEAALQEAAELAAQEVTAQATAALATFVDDATDAKTLEKTVRSMDAVKLLWSGYLPKDLAPHFERAYLDAHQKVRQAQAALVGSALEKTAEELQGPSKDLETIADEGLTGPIAKLLVERLLAARGEAVKGIAEEIQRAAKRFDDLNARRTLASGLATAMGTWRDDHPRAMLAADALKRLALAGIIPQDLHGSLISGILSLDYPSDLILRLEAMRVINNIGEKTQDMAAREAAYKAIVRESLGPNMRRDQDFDYSILMMKRGGQYTEAWDDRMGGLPHQEVVEEYRRRWLRAAELSAKKTSPAKEDLERLRFLEKKYPVLLLNLQIPLNPPVQEKSASGLKTDKTPDLPEPNLN